MGRKKMCFISNVKDSDLKLLRKHTPLDYKRNVSVFKPDTDLETEIITCTEQYAGRQQYV